MQSRMIITNILGVFFSLSGIAGSMSDVMTHKSAPFFYVGGYGGYGKVAGGYKSDGNVAQGRFTLGVYAHHYKQWMFGGEAGVQSGNTMRLSASTSVIDPNTDLPPQAILKPLLDLLFTVKGQIHSDKPFYYIFKGGVAYRQFQLEDRTSTYGDALSKIAGEFQAGLGVNMTDHVLLNAFYQGIYSQNNAGVYLDSAGNTPIAYIPTQQAGFLGVQYLFF